MAFTPLLIKGGEACRRDADGLVRLLFVHAGPPSRHHRDRVHEGIGRGLAPRTTTSCGQALDHLLELFVLQLQGALLLPTLRHSIGQTARGRWGSREVVLVLVLLPQVRIGTSRRIAVSKVTALG